MALSDLFTLIGPETPPDVPDQPFDLALMTSAEWIGLVVSVAFYLDVFVPDPLPYWDEVVLGIGSLFLAVRNGSVFLLIITFMGTLLEWTLQIP